MAGAQVAMQRTVVNYFRASPLLHDDNTIGK